MRLIFLCVHTKYTRRLKMEKFQNLSTPWQSAVSYSDSFKLNSKYHFDSISVWLKIWTSKPVMLVCGIGYFSNYMFVHQYCHIWMTMRSIRWVSWPKENLTEIWVPEYPFFLAKGGRADCYAGHHQKIQISIQKTLPKAQRTRGLSSSCQSHIASSNTNLDRISSSESWLSIN